jgi:hypothetical protein
MESTFSVKGVLLSAMAAMVANFAVGCAGSGPEPDPETRAAIAEETLTIIDCQLEVADCILHASGLAEVDTCRADFVACTGGSAHDLVDTATTTATAAIGAADDCRVDTSSCIGAAKGVSDVLACRGEFEDCVDSLVAVIPVSLPGVSLAPTVKAAIDCPTSAIDCAKGAASAADVLACRTDFESCATGVAHHVVTNVTGVALDLTTKATGLVGKVTAILPAPADVVATADACHAKADACVKSAVTGALSGSVSLATCHADLASCLADVAALVP